MCTRKIAFSILAALALACAGAVHATPGSGVLTGKVWARGKFAQPVDIKIKVEDGRQEVLHVPDTQENVIQQIVLAPGGHTGWHSHPGPAMALITSGALTLYDGDDPACLPHTYTAGQAFVDAGQGHVHMARNLSSTDNAEVWVTYLDVPAGQTPPASPRIEQPNPGNCLF
jgi:quercetin dioxygenase-like cupin family protein